MLFVGLIPGAASQWGSSLYDLRNEPNSIPDTDSTFMHQDANTDSVDMIYFDAVYDHNFLAFPIVPWPNADSTSVQPYGLTYFHAYLGYWRDCNGDGFIGNAVWGGDHYLVDADVTALGICGASTPYSDGVYVYEFLAIGPEANKDFEGTPYGEVCDNTNLCVGGASYFVRDDAAKVWQDWGLPSDQPAATRLLLPFPQGTFSDTNGHFQYVDSLTFGRLSGTGSNGQCLLSDGTNEYCWLWPSTQAKVDQRGDARKEAGANQCTGDTSPNDGLTDDPVANAAAAASSMDCSPVPNAPNPVTSTTRDRYNDSHTAQRGTTIVEPWDWGNPDDSDDCDLKGDAGASSLDASGSVVPTFDHVFYSAVEGCNHEFDESAWPTYSNLEAVDNPSDASKKIESNTFFGGHQEFGGFTMDSWFNPADVGGPDQEVCIPDVSTLNEGMPQTCRGYWLSASQWIRSHGSTGLNPQPVAGDVATFYADVNFADVFGGPNEPRYSAPAGLDDTAAALPAGVDNAHTYGKEQCDLGAASLWNCDPQAWIDAAELGGNAELEHLLPKVLDPYDLRDIECFDNDVADTDLVDQNGAAPGLVVFTPSRDCDTLTI